MPRSTPVRVEDSAENSAISETARIPRSHGPKTASERLSELGSEADAAASGVILPEHLLSKAKMLCYLESYDWQGDAYYAGNAIAAQWREICAAGLADTVTDFLDGIQDKESGLWGNKGGYPAINALLKISSFYRNAHKPMPNPIPAAEAVMDIMSEDISCASVCWQYNTWFSIVNIKEILKNSSQEGEALSREISSRLLLKAPGAILSSARKVKSFLKPDGSFSYKQDRTSPTSQGASVALPDTNEGDVNASVICSGGITQNLWRALGLEPWRIPIFERDSLGIFLGHVKM